MEVIAQLSWVSPKGYGLAVLEGGENAFIPVEVVKKHKAEKKIGKKISVRLADGSLGKIITEMEDASDL